MDDKLWAFAVVTVMWAGVLFYVFQLNKKVKHLEKMLDEGDE